MAGAAYVVGQWVRGRDFYGRKEVLAQILDGNRNGLWLLGGRRVGKTSVLKQVEMLADAEDERRYLPLFWDLQGADRPADLHEGFADALLDAEERLDELGLAIDEIEGPDLFASLNTLRRQLRVRGLTLLLLCDEAEELLAIHGVEPRFLRRLRRALQSKEGIRTVLSSNLKLWELADEHTSTSPFLHGFTPPLSLSGLDPGSARELMRQSGLAEDSRPGISDADNDTICRLCNNHPYLLQVLGERFARLGDLERATAEIATDEMVTHFFTVDFRMFSATERELVRRLRDDDSPGLDELGSPGGLRRLEQLGFVVSGEDGGYRLGNHFLRCWSRAQLDSALEQRSRSSASELEATLTLASDGRSIGTIDGRYELVGRLGHGAAGEVFRARDTLLDTEVALKLLRIAPGEVELLTRLRREVLLARTLSHPNIVKTFDLGSVGEQLYVTMELIEGRDLAEVLAGQPRLPIERFYELAYGLSDALAAAHRQGVMHRDLKPANILVDRSGRPRIADFGLARGLGDPGITRSGVFVGTPAYASPEQIRSAPVDARSDVYSLGVVLYELATGRRPFLGPTLQEVLQQHLENEAVAPMDLRPELGERLSTVILKCLAKQVDDRFADGTALHLGLVALEIRT